ncbi:tRNA uridine-5-carboxymethylaminomethyl(34) synthesis GTPase MnmE [Geoalkalibacter sp.]|uniref:tRNA uridine-5-carboxymethylaminomethyl(34) synthesis GTPase MnmE n=1 Tax=Geoalkalibacter sp. TaxID=3041440 RepID=UPI00272E30E4|nr:tRNA uridine-5-carboxymethylaminomethyl(34) synthesis GTPase MnmE [Geoalkalibacter sp.]
MDYADRATIAGPATVFGQGGIGIIRVSGEGALPLLRRIFQTQRPTSAFTSHRLYYGRIVDESGDAVDEAMAVYMRAPYTYTREDVVELHCHGGAVVGRRVLDLLMAQGARLALPGEFTLRAFLNGRIDLSQAEGVMEVIGAQSLLGQKIALRHLQGRLRDTCTALRERLCDALALVEAWIDFPEEDLDPATQEAIGGLIIQVHAQLQGLIDSFRTGRVLREGVGVLILGRPNVGKSSLLNALLGSSRAIVTELPGTTRDTIEEQLDLAGLRVRLIDTAGLRQSADLVEQEGVRRSRDKIAEADLILLVIDGHQGAVAEDLAVLEACGDKPVLLVINKQDLGARALPEAFSGLSRIYLSARTGEGMPLLRDGIRQVFLAREPQADQESLVVTEARHHDCFTRCLDALHRALGTLQKKESLEFLAFELHAALDILGEITGETAPEDIIQRIFSKFCIGK